MSEVVSGAEGSAARVCVSSDGQCLGTIVGIHRDPVSDAAKWAVLDGGDAVPGRLFVPLVGAVPRRDGLHLPFDAARVAAAPQVEDPADLSLAEESGLLEHYGLPAAGDDSAGWMTRSEERLAVTALEWRPYRRARVRRVVTTEDVTQVVTVRREELVVEEEPVDSVERLEAAFGLVEPPPQQDIAIVLHREEVVVQKRVLPYERVAVRRVATAAQWQVEETLRSEVVEVEREALRAVDES